MDVRLLPPQPAIAVKTPRGSCRLSMFRSGAFKSSPPHLCGCASPPSSPPRRFDALADGPAAAGVEQVIAIANRNILFDDSHDLVLDFGKRGTAIVASIKDVCSGTMTQ